MKSKLPRILVAATALTLVSGLPGCQLFGALSTEEQAQIRNLREVKKYLMPASSTALNTALRNWGYLSAFDLPTKYGMELSSYVAMLPFSGPTVQVTPQYNLDPNQQKLLTHAWETSVTDITASTAVSGNTHTYTVKLNKCRYGATGTLTVATTGTTWNPTSVRPTSWRYDAFDAPRSPQSLVATLNGSVAGTQVGLRANLIFSGQTIPRQGTFSMTLPGIIFEASSVQFTSEGSATLSGTLALGTTTYNANIQAEGSQLHGTLENTKLGYNVTFDYDGSVLTAEIKNSRNGSRNLAVIDVDNDKQVVRYADGTTEDFSLKVVGGS